MVWGGIAYKYGAVAIAINLCYGVSALLVGWLLAGVWRRAGVDSAAEFLPHIRGVDARVEAMAGKPGDDGSGGMVTKLSAARIALSAGCHMLIANGRDQHALQGLYNGSARCTWFEATTSPRTAYKQWIAGSLRPKGRLVIDAGAAKALAQGRSLLPAGVRQVEDDFERGDAVIVVNVNATEVGCGLTAYSAADARLLMGHKSSEIEDLLGYRGSDELIHRDDLVLS